MFQILLYISINLLATFYALSGTIKLSNGLHEGAHITACQQIDKIVHTLIPGTERSNIPILIRILWGSTELLFGCCLIWFRGKRLFALLVLLIQMLVSIVLYSTFHMSIDLPVTICGLLLFSLVCHIYDRGNKSDSSSSSSSCSSSNSGNIKISGDIGNSSNDKESKRLSSTKIESSSNKNSTPVKSSENAFGGENKKDE